MIHTLAQSVANIIDLKQRCVVNIHLTINGSIKQVTVESSETLLSVLRREGYYSVKHGCETGECGACAVLMKLPQASHPSMVNTCVMLAVQADGGEITTVESLGDRTQLSVLQQAFIDNGAIQCGYCIPAQLLAAKALLDQNPNPSEAEIREAISGVLCRCTGYVKPVQAIQNAAAILRGETDHLQGPSYTRVVAPGGSTLPANTADQPWGETPSTSGEPQRSTQTQTETLTTTLAPFVVAAEQQTAVVGKAEKKVDAVKLGAGQTGLRRRLPAAGHALCGHADQPARPCAHHRHPHRQSQSVAGRTRPF